MPPGLIALLEAGLERWQGLRQVGKMLLRDGRNAREGDRDDVSGVFVSAAVDDGSAAVNFLVLGSGLKIESQFAPERNCFDGKEGDAVFSDVHRMIGQGKFHFLFRCLC